MNSGQPQRARSYSSSNSVRTRCSTSIMRALTVVMHSHKWVRFHEPTSSPRGHPSSVYIEASNERWGWQGQLNTQESWRNFRFSHWIGSGSLYTASAGGLGWLVLSNGSYFECWTVETLSFSTSSQDDECIIQWGWAASSDEPFQRATGVEWWIPPLCWSTGWLD